MLPSLPCRQWKLPPLESAKDFLLCRIGSLRKEVDYAVRRYEEVAGRLDPNRLRRHLRREEDNKDQYAN